MKPCKEARKFKIRPDDKPKTQVESDKSKCNILHKKALDAMEEIMEKRMLKEYELD